MNGEELKYQIALSLTPNIGPVTVRRLIHHFGTAKNTFEHSPEELKRLMTIGDVRARSILSKRDLEKAEEQLEYAEKENIRVVSMLSNEYPSRLNQCSDAPVVLFVSGEVDLNPSRVVSIVGTRNATANGRELCRNLVEDMAGKDVMVVSGMARGIDIEAHRAAMKFGVPTVAVLGHGLNRMYPLSHHRDAMEMIDAGGGLVTEFPRGTQPDRENFPKRNRVVAGMVDITVVVESGVSGGSIITATIAHSYGRDVAAFPGRPSDVTFRGCNKLIRQLKAALIESSGDLFRLMNWDQEKPKQAVQKPMFLDLSDDERPVYDLLNEGQPVQLDELCEQLGKPVSQLSAILLTMELNGVIRALPGKRFEAC